MEDEETESSWKESYEKGRAELAELKNINRIGNGKDETFGRKSMRGAGGIDATEFKTKIDELRAQKSNGTISEADYDTEIKNLSDKIIEGLKTFKYDNGKILSDDAILAYIYDTFDLVL